MLGGNRVLTNAVAIPKRSAGFFAIAFWIALAALFGRSGALSRASGGACSMGAINSLYFLSGVHSDYSSASFPMDASPLH